MEFKYLDFYCIWNQYSILFALWILHACAKSLKVVKHWKRKVWKITKSCKSAKNAKSCKKSLFFQLFRSNKDLENVVSNFSKGVLHKKFDISHISHIRKFNRETRFLVFMAWYWIQFHAQFAHFQSWDKISSIYGS